MNFNTTILFAFIFCFLILCIGSIRCCCNSDDTVILDRKNTDVLRGIAAFAIVLHHLCQYVTNQNAIFSFFGFIGDLCVAIFFLLSGYSNRMSYKRVEKSTTKYKIIWGGQK